MITESFPKEEMMEEEMIEEDMLEEPTEMRRGREEINL
jgi:hypothetical protein